MLAAQKPGPDSHRTLRPVVDPDTAWSVIALVNLAQSDPHELLGEPLFLPHAIAQLLLWRGAPGNGASFTGSTVTSTAAGAVSPDPSPTT